MDEPKEYESVPTVKQAMRFTGENLDKVLGWLDSQNAPARGDDTSVTLETLEGEMRADVGDWIIKGIAGEFYPCKPDVFDRSYRELGA